MTPFLFTEPVYIYVVGSRFDQLQQTFYLFLNRQTLCKPALCEMCEGRFKLLVKPLCTKLHDVENNTNILIVVLLLLFS